ncbi:DUF5659 domain-containing protein [Pseudalkalibacillus sp. JSM 102089]|uniref:DUF5659 domain-containing protein n=1 Tax=Pseudalkalibacillus sp. JSM 102089 TaxID=3229856 RepID=UPI0035235A9A
MSHKKKVFSRALMSYLITEGHEVTSIGYDPNTNKSFYCFPETEEVASDIRKYNNDIWLRTYNANFKDINKNLWEAKQ